MKLKSIVIVTSAQPSANPRVVKEAIFLNSVGYKVTVIFAPISSWADIYDENLINSNPDINWEMVGYHKKKQPFLYFFARVRRKIYELMFLIYAALVKSEEKAFILFSQELTARAKSIKADLYIGHNLGALPSAVNAAKLNNSKCGFDAEDYHRGEVDLNSIYYKLSIKIENKYFPKINYLTAASPAILNQYLSLFPDIKIAAAINNVFSVKYLQKPTLSSKNRLKLFWFSQTIGAGRGLEVVINAINILQGYDISLTLLGNCGIEYKSELENLIYNKSLLKILTAVEPDKIFEISSKYDIGLSVEIPTTENRNLCLTNKLFTYLISGNCIITTNTYSQLKFINKYSGIGYSFNYDNPHDLANLLVMLYENNDVLMSCKNISINYAKNDLNWELESKKLITVFKSLNFE